MVSGVSVVVPTYGGAHRLATVLAPVLADPATAELIVVVDGSRDGSMEVLAALARTDSRVKATFQENAGAGAARQAGADRAGCAQVLLLDDDVLAGPGLVTGHLRVAAQHPGCVVVGSMPVRLPPPGSRLAATTSLYAREYDACTDAYRREPHRLLEHLWTGNVSMPREVALRVGLGDPEMADLFPFEDRELGLRLRALDTCARYAPELRAEHLHTRSLRRFQDDARRQGRAMHVLATRHPDVVPPPTPQALHGWLPGPLRLLLTAVHRSPAAGGPLGALAVAATWAAGAAGRRELERRCLLLVRHVAQAQGAGSATRG